MTVRKRGLGRGLDALLQKEEIAPSITSLPVGSLKANQFQPRTQFDDDSLTELTDSIRTQGLVQPIVVTPESDGSYSIIAGERRWRAAVRAGLDSVPVVVRTVVDDRERLELALVENLQRSDLNPLEEAEAYSLLQEKFALSQEEVAIRVGKSRVAVTNSLRLLKLPEEIRALIHQRKLTAGQARPLLAMPRAEDQVDLAERAVREGLSARDLERLASEPKPPVPKKEPEPAEVHAVAAQETLTRRLQTRVEIRRKGRGGLVQIHFHSEDELMRLYELLMERGDNE